METKSNFEKFDELHVDWRAKEFLKEAAKWAKFLAIVGFVGVGIMILGAITMLVFGASGSVATVSIMPFGSSVMLVIVYAAVGLLYFFPLYYLYKFSENAALAVKSNNNSALMDSMKFLKSHYKFMGILVLIILSIYALVFLIAVLGAIGSNL